jgi:hypothetical protein
VGLAVSFLSVNSFAKTPLQCASLFLEIETQAPRMAKFEDGHNVPLRNIMFKIREYESAIADFVDGLNPAGASKYLKDDSEKYRNPQALTQTLEIAKKYEHILTHLVEHADSIMMSARIERVPPEQRAEFIEKYKLSYVHYLATYKELVSELESFQSQDPKSWDNKILREILMDLNNQMGNAHNRF